MTDAGFKKDFVKPVEKEQNKSNDDYTPLEIQQIEANRAIELKRLDNQNNKDNMGGLGYYLGNREHQVVFFTALIMILCLMMVIAMVADLIWGSSNTNMKEAYIDKFLAVITLCLGYLFGKAKE